MSSPALPVTTDAQSGLVGSRPWKSFDNVCLLFLGRYQSPETRRTYGSTLRDFGDFFLRERSRESLVEWDLNAIEEEDVLNFRLELENAHRLRTHSRTVRKVQTTLARKLSTLRSFFAFAHRRGFMAHNPAEHLPPTRVLRQSKTRALTPQELGAMLQSLESSSRHAPTLRKRKADGLSYAIIVTLGTTGLRVSELCNLKRRDFRRQERDGTGELIVGRKGGKIQRIFLHPFTTEVLRRHINSGNSEDAQHEQWPLFSRTQRTATLSPLTPKAIRNMITSAARSAGLSGKLPSPHALRAGLATELHRQGIALPEIQDLLGHSSPETTALYVKKLRDTAEAPSLKLKLSHSNS